MRSTGVIFALLAFTAAGDLIPAAEPTQPAPQANVAQSLRAQLDAPLLFVKRHSYTGIHIYDTFYKWPPGGGGIYVVENPAAPRAQWNIRAVIDPSTPETLGEGVYSHPALSWDATRLLFCFKGEPHGSTSIYEIGVDGRGLRRVTDPTAFCECYKGSHSGQHDVGPEYLPDGRIVFLSTRPSGLVPCANEGVAILHVMNADGSDIHPISVNNVNEFDPSVMHDGSILFGRWEYVDKNALTIQSLWTVNPDGTNETALFANNMVFPEAILDARAVPGSPMIVGSFTKHNGPPRGSIALVDPRLGKNGPQAIINLEHPDNPTFDRGESCEPWPLSEDVVLLSGRPPGQARNILQMIDRSGNRVELLSDAAICLHSPMLLKPRKRPPAIADRIDRQAKTGQFFLQDIYQGLPEVKRGEVKWLRVIEETSRVSPTPGGNSPYNQTFLVSCALAFSAKNYLGVVPVEDDGSAFFEVPAGRAVYLQALDRDGRLVQSMRTFVQAAPGMTRSCIGCHEHKYTTSAAAAGALAPALGREPSRLRPESWGDGLMDYPTMVQPVLDRRCVRCHGGDEGIAAGIDLSGGWTEHFNISYENLTNRRISQLEAYWIAGIDCMNGTALWSSRRFAPRGHGSGAAPLAELLVAGHDGRIDDLTRTERDLLLAWIDSNGLYHGSWDFTTAGCAQTHWGGTKNALVGQMQRAGCLQCHGDGNRPLFFENDWINLQQPEMSRLLRAPLAVNGEGAGLAMCRQRKIAPGSQRVRLLCNGYAHAVQPPEAFPRRQFVAADDEGEPVVSFDSPDDAHYQAMLAIIRKARDQALANPRVDMPGARRIAGECRHFERPTLPVVAPPLTALADADGSVHLSWPTSSQTVGVAAELHRSDQGQFAPSEETLLSVTSLGRHCDNAAPAGEQHYALVLTLDEQRSEPTYTVVSVPTPPPPAPPTGLSVVPSSSAVRLAWQASPDSVRGYHVYRALGDGQPTDRVTAQPVAEPRFADVNVELGKRYSYVVRAVSRRGVESLPSGPVQATAEVITAPMVHAPLTNDVNAALYGEGSLAGAAHGGARIADGVLKVGGGGYVAFPHVGQFDLSQPLTVAFWVRLDNAGKIPVLVCCGHWNQAGWFLQRLGPTWRWHVGGVDCDGGQGTVGQWLHLTGIYDGRALRLYENGKLLSEKAATPNTAVWPGPLHVGQYGQVGGDFQTTGAISDLRIYHRALSAEDVAELAAPPPAQ